MVGVLLGVGLCQEGEDEGQDGGEKWCGMHGGYEARNAWAVDGGAPLRLRKASEWFGALAWKSGVLEGPSPRTGHHGVFEQTRWADVMEDLRADACVITEARPLPEV